MELFKKIELLETDASKLEQIERFQSAFEELKANCAKEYSSTTHEVLTKIKNKMKANPYMKSAVESYVNTYVIESLRERAKESLYDMLSAEMVQTLQTLSHASCVVC